MSLSLSISLEASTKAEAVGSTFIRPVYVYTAWRLLCWGVGQVTSSTQGSIMGGNVCVRHPIMHTHMLTPACTLSSHAEVQTRPGRRDTDMENKQRWNGFLRGT